MSYPPKRNGIAQADLDDGRDELLEEAGDLEEGGEEEIEEIDDQAFYVRPVVVLARRMGQ